ncbi:outer membrane receptor protein involved in Fe transport [Arcicella aurantiaca]|uniref:Outer membrane receptor protein involved in Fe transport n=1 Tax=Arcicella aurantiaca TaxID=591202 RepID=A0A316E8L8_9BACT|nr:TonB-dependent receptor [Arcicella aurantiaca]PWK26416.1 outer membrane receptor protein involved in Fe transport [Arcicella aurantiaca]
MKKTLLLFIFFSSLITHIFSQNTKITISGSVKESGSGELLPGVSVYVQGQKMGTQTNNYGFYSLTVNTNEKITLVFSFVGYLQNVKEITSLKSQTINIELPPENRQLDEVKVLASSPQQQKLSETAQMSQVSIPVQQIKEIPAFMGEKDVLKVLQLMPGVQKGSEGNVGIYVRGGGADQNLLILDDAPVYNAYHLFGFFSVFNGDALKSVELTKGGFPARYGGRLSSVIEMQMKDGNKEKMQVEGGIGLIASRLVVQGPISKNHRSSFLVSGRRTYVDIPAALFIPTQNAGSTYYFYDLNAKVNYDFNNTNRLFLSGYFGRDKGVIADVQLNRTNNAGLNWGNATGTMRWNHIFNEKLFSNVSLIHSSYQFETSIENKGSILTSNTSLYNLSYSSSIRDFGAKVDFDFYPNSQHSIKFGVQATAHRFTPSALVVADSSLNTIRESTDIIDAVESGAYMEDTYRPFSNLRINLGLRFTSFTTNTVSYQNPEPRLSVALTLPNNLAVKASYAKMNQYIHLLSNSGVGLPTDLWVPSTSLVKPERSQQVAFGLAKDLPEKGLTLTLEGYYKKMDNIIAYKEGSTFATLSIDGPQGLARSQVNVIPFEDKVTAGQGWAYGSEFLVQKKAGRLTGWVGYTLSWIRHQFDELNFGKEFWAKYDRRHDASIVGIYQLKPRITLSATWVYGTGNAITLPDATYRSGYKIAGVDQAGVAAINYRGEFRELPDYGERNSYRAAPYHRLDASIQFHKKMKRHERTWEFSVYNLYNRRNPYFYDFKSTNNAATGITTKTLAQYSIFTLLPAFSYSFKF